METELNINQTKGDEMYCNKHKVHFQSEVWDCSECREAYEYEHDYQEGMNHGTLHAKHPDFPLGDDELSAYPELYQKGYRIVYYGERGMR